MEKPLTHKIKIEIGDWSNDGHGHFETYVFDSNYSVEDIQTAYKESCKKVGVQFNHNTSYIETKYEGYNNPYHICTNYEDASITEEASDLLLKYDIDVAEYSTEHDEILFDADSILNLILDFIKISISDLELMEGSFRRSELCHMPTVNSGDLNHHFGYGVFDD